MRLHALRALTSYDDPRISPQPVAIYPSLAPDEKSAVLKDTTTKRGLSPISMMPDGLPGALQQPEVRDLFLYLRQSKDP